MLWFRMGVVLSLLFTMLLGIALVLAVLVMCVNPANGKAMNSDPFYNGTLFYYILVMLSELGMIAAAMFGFAVAFKAWRNNNQMDHTLRQLFTLWLGVLSIAICFLFILGILGLVRYREATEEMTALYEIFSKYNQDVKFVGSFERYQRENSCCGINGPDDWMMAQVKGSSGGGYGYGGGGYDSSYMGSPSTGKCHLTPPTIPMGCGKKLLEEIHFAMAVYSGVIILQTMCAIASAALGWYCFFYWIEKEVIIIPEDEVSNLIVIEPESSISEYTLETDEDESYYSGSGYGSMYSGSQSMYGSGSRYTGTGSYLPTSGDYLGSRFTYNGYSGSRSFYPNSSRLSGSGGTKFSNFNGAIPSFGGPHSAYLQSIPDQPEGMTGFPHFPNGKHNKSKFLGGSIASKNNNNNSRYLYGLGSMAGGSIGGSFAGGSMGGSIAGGSMGGSIAGGSMGGSIAGGSMGGSRAGGSGTSPGHGVSHYGHGHSGSVRLHSGKYARSVYHADTRAGSSWGYDSVKGSYLHPGSYINSGSYMGSSEFVKPKKYKRVKKEHSENHMLHLQEKALGGRVLAEMHVDHERDPDPMNSKMNVAKGHHGRRAHHATIAIIKSKHPPKPKNFWKGEGGGPGQTGNIAADILDMSGGAAAVKSLVDDINLPVEHDPALLEGEPYVNKLHRAKKQKSQLDHPDPDHPGHGPVHEYDGVLAAPAIDGSQAQSLVDMLLKGRPKPPEPPVKPHEVNEEPKKEDESKKRYKGHKHPDKNTSKHHHHHHHDHHDHGPHSHDRSHHDHGLHSQDRSHHDHGHRSRHTRDRDDHHHHHHPRYRTNSRGSLETEVIYKTNRNF